ncbi:uncharacterized protein LOC115223561 isoform X1 [Argonauta hians]
MATQTSFFLGRHIQREALKTWLLYGKTQILQIYGLPFVGKTALLKTVCEELKEEIQPERLHTKHIHISPDTPWSAIHNMYHTFTSSVSFTNTRWKMCIFDDFHNINDGLLTNFQQLCDNDFPQHTNLKVILILNGGKPHEFDGISFSQCKVDPLSMEEAEVIFCRYSGIAVDKQNKPQINKLIRYSCGLPGVLIHLTNRVSQFCPNFSLKDIVNMICDEDSISDWLQDCSVNRRNVKTEIDKYFSKLSPKQQNAIKLLSYFPGRFGIQEATEMIDSASQPSSKVNVLMPLVEQGLINSDFDMESFQVQELMRAIALQQIDNVSSNDLVKLKFTKIIGNCLLKAQGFYEKGLTMEALGILSNNWENIANIMKKGIDPPSDGKTFAVYYNIAMKASDLLMICHPCGSREFFQACLHNSALFGNEVEQAFMKIAYGVSITDLPGYEGYKDAMMFYHKALAVLQSKQIQYRQIQLYCSMAYNAYMQGKYQEALTFAETGYKMNATDADPRLVDYAKVRCASTMAYNLSFLGYYDRCEKLVLENLARLPEDHPNVAVMLNTLGINYQRNGAQHLKALHYYQASLIHRLKLVAVNPKRCIVAYCNVSEIMSLHQGNHDMALKLLLKAEDIQRQNGWQHMNTSLVLHHIARVYFRMGKLNEGLATLQEAVSIYNKVEPRFLGRVKLVLLMAHCYLLKEEFTKATQCFQNILTQETNRLHSCVSELEAFSMAMEHLVYLNMNDPQEQLSCMENLLKELQSLLQQSVSLDHHQHYSRAIDKYQRLRMKLLERLQLREQRSGIFIDSLPHICYNCKTFKNILNTSQDNYILQLSGFRIASSLSTF